MFKGFDETMADVVANLKNRVADLESRDTFTRPSAGSILFGGTSGAISQDNANLFWDDSNDRLGLGTNAPEHRVTLKAGLDTTVLHLNQDSGGANVVHGYLFAGYPGVTYQSLTLGCNWKPTSGSATGRKDTSIGASHVSARTNLILMQVFSSAGALQKGVQIDANGVGIDVAPSFSLDVGGNSQVRGDMYMLKGSSPFIGNRDNFDVRFGVNSSEVFRITTGGDVVPSAAGTRNLGNASLYWNDVSYKTLTDRGCIAITPMWELPDGRRVSNLQVFRELKPHSAKKTIYGETMLDYTTVPVVSRKPAPIATEDVYEDIYELDPDDPGQSRQVRVLRWRKGEQMGEDGVEMTSLFSMMIGALRELAERVETLERRPLR